MKRILLLLPCNSCVRLGDYSLCQNWRTVLRYVGDLVEAGIVDLAAIDSCKPGVVLWGEEYRYSWCDIRPYWGELYGRDSFRFYNLVEAIERDLRSLYPSYRHIVMYINVKAYKLAVLEASSRLGLDILDLSPSHFSPLSFRSNARLLKLRGGLLELCCLSSHARP